MGNLIKVGDTFKNKNETEFLIEKISKTGSVLSTRTRNGEEQKFRWYEASGQYIMVGSVNTELGEFVENLIKIKI